MCCLKKQFKVSMGTRLEGSEVCPLPLVPPSLSPKYVPVVQGSSGETKTGDKCPFPLRVCLVRCRAPRIRHVLAILWAGRRVGGSGTCVLALPGLPGEQSGRSPEGTWQEEGEAALTFQMCGQISLYLNNNNKQKNTHK